MRKLRTTVILVGTVAALGAIAYRMLLSDEARTGLRNAATAVKDACETVCDTVNESYGVVMDDELPNRERTQRQWEELGY